MIGKFQKRYIVNKNLVDLNPRDFGLFTVFQEYSHCQNNDMYYLYYVLGGKFYMQIGDNTDILAKGDMCIVNPYTDYCWSSDKDDPCKIMWVGFDGKYAQRFAEILEGETVQYDGPLFREMWEASYRVCREEFIAGLMMQLYCEMAERKLPPPISHHVRDAKDYIELNYNHPDLSINKIAKVVGIDRRYMSRIFKDTEGVTPQGYLTKIRMGRATELLSMGFPVSEVSAMCGYSSPFHFSTMFKKYNSISPSEYRDNTKN